MIDACFGFDTVSFVPARSPIEIIQESPRYKVYRVCTSCWPIILNISWRVVMFDLFFFPRDPLEEFLEASILERQIYYDDKRTLRKGANIKG